MIYSSLWYLFIGFLLGNGMPHFIFGVAGKTFRTPFGRHSSPKRNVYWGLFNFIVASIIALWRIDIPIQTWELVLLIGGFWFAVLMFSISIKNFLSDTK
jgi:hypothetical protein